MNRIIKLLSILALLLALLGQTTAITTAQDPEPGGSGEEITPASFATLGSGFLYVLRVEGGSTENQIHGYRVDELTGALTVLPGFPVATGGYGAIFPTGEQMVFDSLNSRLFVINAGALPGGAPSFSVFQVNPTTGTLTALPNSPVPLPSGQWYCLAVHPTGSPVVLGDALGSVATYRVSLGGAVAAGGPYSTGAAVKPASCTFSGDGAYFYTGGSSGTSIAGFTVNAETGVLSSVATSPIDSGGLFPSALAGEASSRIFVSNRDQVSGIWQVRAFEIQGGNLAASTALPSGLFHADFGLLHPAGYYLVADATGPRVGVYRVSGDGTGTTLAAVNGSPFSTGAGTTPRALALNASGSVLYAANGNRTVSIFNFNAGSGALLQRPSVTVSASGLLTGMAYAGKRLPAAQTGGFLYALQDSPSGNHIYGFRVNEATGGLEALPDFPVPTLHTGSLAWKTERLAFDRANHRLYAINDGDDRISAYQVDTLTGGLTPLSFSPIDLTDGTWSCLAVHPSGSPLVVGSSDGLLVSYTVTTDVVSPIDGNQYVTQGVQPDSCAFRWDGNYFYAGGGFTGGIYGYSVTQSDGHLVPINTIPFGNGTQNVQSFAFDNQHRLFSATLSPSLVVFDATDGALAPADGIRFDYPMAYPMHGIWHSAGYYLTGDWSSNRVAVHRIAGSGTATTLTAVDGSPFASGGFGVPILATNASGAFVFSANNESRSITTFAFDASYGILAGLSIQPVDTLGSDGAISGLAYVPPPDGEVQGYLYSLSSSSIGNWLYGFSVASETGALSLLPGFPLDTGGEGTLVSPIVEQVVYDRAAGRLFVLNSGNDMISAYTVDHASGALTPYAFHPIYLRDLSMWTCLAINPMGTVLVAGAASGSQLVSYALVGDHAVEAPGSPYSTVPNGPYSCAFSRDGGYFYTGGASGQDIAGFEVNGSTGELTPLPGMPVSSGGLNPVAFAVDLGGRFYQAEWSGGRVRAYLLSAYGDLEQVAGSPFRSGLVSAVEGLYHPAGYYVVSDFDAGRIGVYKVSGNGMGTRLDPVPGSPFWSAGEGTGPLALDQDGHFLFAANTYSSNVTVFKMDPDPGELSGSYRQAASSLGPAPNLINGLAYVPIPPDMGLTVSHPGTVFAGETVTYTLHVTNLGLSTSRNTEGIAIGWQVPEGLNIVNSSGTGWTCYRSDPYVNCTYPEILYGGTSLPDLVFTVSVAPRLGGTIDNYFYLNSGGFDPVYANNIIHDSLQVQTRVFVPAVLR